MTGSVDWNRVWMENMEGISWRRLHGDGNNFWDQRAKQLENQRKVNRDVSVKTISKMGLSPKYTVIDIGAGTGALTIPIARIAKSVTAIEPSTKMLDCLEQNAQSENLSNIRYVKKFWDDITPFEEMESHDVLIASHSLLMKDMKAALQKMDLLAKKRVYLITSANRNTGYYNELWKRLYEEEYKPSPGYVCLYNILYDMGICANVEISEVEYRQPFSSREEAVTLWIENLRATSPEAKEIVRKFISESIVVEDGHTILKNRTKWATIWWETESAI